MVKNETFVPSAIFGGVMASQNMVNFFLGHPVDDNEKAEKNTLHHPYLIVSLDIFPLDADWVHASLEAGGWLGLVQADTGPSVLVVCGLSVITGLNQLPPVLPCPLLTPQATLGQTLDAIHPNIGERKNRVYVVKWSISQPTKVSLSVKQQRKRDTITLGQEQNWLNHPFSMNKNHEIVLWLLLKEYINRYIENSIMKRSPL